MIRVALTYSSESANIQFIPPYTTAEVFELHVGVLLMGWTEAEKLVACAGWCEEYTPDHTSADLLKLLGLEVFDLAGTIVRAAALPTDSLKGAARLFDIGTGADEFDSGFDDKPCNCVKCAGIPVDVEGAAPCKFDGISQDSRQLSDWGFLTAHPEFLSAPYSLYQLAQARQSAIVRGQGADRQKRKKEQEAKEDAKRIREKYGHKW